MNSLIKLLKIPKRVTRFPSYSTTSGQKNIEQCDVLSSDEIDLEVCERC